MVIHVLAKAWPWAFFSFFIKKTVAFSWYNYQMKGDTLHSSPPACLDGRSAACCSGGEERTKSKLGHGGGWRVQLGLWAKDLPGHFPAFFCRVTKTVASIFPACQSEPPASCLISVLYPGGEGLSSTHRPLSEPQPLSAISPVTLLPLLLPGVALGCVLVGGHKLSRSLAIPARSALGLSQPGLHWREVPVVVHLQRGPLAMHFQDVHPGVAAWNQSRDVVCPTGSAWQLPGPVAL